MGLRYLLDTNICIYIAKNKPIAVAQRFEKLERGEIAMSAITYGELLYGAEKSQYSKKSREILEKLTTLIPALPITLDVCEQYAIIRANLEKRGKPIGNNDLWICSHALALKVILVTNNLKEFNRVAHLKVENWI